ncbi:YheC/YheD family protein [Cohnella lubricantis]|uniref:YheC/YheD family protein n=1 Tax=Cohnella lubricantis TaxID=2163172 RepID=A0A841TB71_9BACL|nr:YheC/YheD family protein [Cohnella lubricantis]MBB6678252.1 YheC/YheD family protein [Cohnella lubricantis]MBP2120106.1 glutathione synthase/RimK-type ligase-like ATP-grasp enzyme [Cohnella lubricantis]
MTIQRVRSKSAKTKALLANPEMALHVPQTRPMNRQSVREMLQQYGMIYVKPVNGTFGRGVIRLEWRANRAHPYWFQSSLRQYRFRTFEAMYAKLLTVKRTQSYLAQQGIELLRHEDRRFDFRVMVQRSPQGIWETTGIIGRLAHPRKIVTNYHSGGTPMPAETLLLPYLGDEPALQAYRGELEALGVEVARTLEQRFPRLQEIGIDVAVDSELNPWILEVNTLPDPYLFRKLNDPAIFRRIYEYAVAYGRFPRKRRKLAPK